VKSRKGAAALISVVVFVLIGTGSIFSGIIQSSEIKKTINYSTGQVNQLMEAKTKAEIYDTNMRHELRYAHNNIGFRADTKTWSEIPTKDQLRQRFKQNLLNSQYGLREQNRVSGCAAPPITESDLKLENSQITLNLTGKYVHCFTGDSEAYISIKEKWRTENKYLQMAFKARRLAQEFNPDASTATAESSCSDTIDREEVRQEAKNNAISGNPASEAVNSVNTAGIDVSRAETIISGDFSTQTNGCSNGQRLTAEFTPETVTANYTLKNGDVMTHEGMEELKYRIEFQKQVE
jgi:hypothetical protein